MVLHKDKAGQEDRKDKECSMLLLSEPGPWGTRPWLVQAPSKHRSVWRIWRHPHACLWSFHTSVPASSLHWAPSEACFMHPSQMPKEDHGHHPSYNLSPASSLQAQGGQGAQVCGSSSWVGHWQGHTSHVVTQVSSRPRHWVHCPFRKQSLFLPFIFPHLLLNIGPNEDQTQSWWEVWVKKF